jgi:hypothetical protein
MTTTIPDKSDRPRPQVIIESLSYARWDFHIVVGIYASDRRVHVMLGNQGLDATETFAAVKAAVEHAGGQVVDALAVDRGPKAVTAKSKLARLLNLFRSRKGKT